MNDNGIKEARRLCMTQQQEDDFKKIAWSTLLIRTVTEFAAVLFQLVCFSRLGANDYYYIVNMKTGETEQRSQDEPSLAANLVLFVTLVLFQFPFMNAYIVFMYDVCVIARTSWLRVLCCFWLLTIQIVAVVMAWLVIRDVQGRWKGMVTWIVPEFVATDSKYQDFSAEFWEEFFAVTALLVGYIHLTYLNFGGVGLFRSSEHLFSEFSVTTRQLPIPMTFILQVTLLVAGLLRAFPRAHLSPHISCYLLIMRYTTWGRFYFRMLGGVLAFIVAYILFWCAYEPRTRVHKRAKEAKALEDDEDALMHAGHGSGRTADLRPGIPMISFNNAYRQVYHSI